MKGADVVPYQSCWWLCIVIHGALHRRSHIYIHLHLRHLADTLIQSGLLYLRKWSDFKWLNCKHSRKMRKRSLKVKKRVVAWQKKGNNLSVWLNSLCVKCERCCRERNLSKVVLFLEDTGKIRYKCSMNVVGVWDLGVTPWGKMDARKNNCTLRLRSQLQHTFPSLLRLIRQALGECYCTAPPSKQRSSTHSHQEAHFESIQIRWLRCRAPVFVGADKWRGSIRHLHLIHLIKHRVFVVMRYIWIKLEFFKRRGNSSNLLAGEAPVSPRK